MGWFIPHPRHKLKPLTWSVIASKISGITTTPYSRLLFTLVDSSGMTGTAYMLKPLLLGGSFP